MSTDKATIELRELLHNLATPVPFGSSVSEEFRRGYSAGRTDVLGFIDTSVTAMLAELPRADQSSDDHGER